MKPERWQQLDKLFHSALECPSGGRAAFLDDACAGDDSLRKQVEELLLAHDEGASFMESPALDVEAKSVANDHIGSLVGQTIGHYKIISSIGVGGMGEVYLAQDMQLGRRVALKLLPARFTQDTDRVRRFQREARSASALNHPNIITIHEIGQAEERHFIATEFIDGETLREHISGSQSLTSSAGNLIADTGIQHSEALSIAMQVADALAAAHAKGILHRDIKPENIILVRDSHLLQKESFVKLLDFGLAKLTEQTTGEEADATTRVLLSTHEGSVIGTASYMSPEQARGERVDARTDIWSLGIVLYEMLSSGVPFGGDTAQDVIASILKEEPPPIPVEIPDRLRWIVEKALRKNREERYQTAREMFSDLRLVREDAVHTFKGPTVTTEETAARRTSNIESLFGKIKLSRTAAVITLGVFLFVLAGIAWGGYKFINQRRQTLSQAQAKQKVPFQKITLAKLTSTGKAADAAISPDGSYVAYVVDDGGKQSLWLRQVSPVSNVQIVPPAPVYFYGGITFSRDGKYIYYTIYEKEGSFSTLHQVPTLGGTSRKLVTDIDSVVTFSPDGKQLVFLRGYATGESALLVANADGNAERKLALRKTPDTFGASGVETAAWSPDGKVIACPAGSTDARGRYMTLVEVRVDDGSVKPISSERWWQVGRIAWLRDGSGLIFTAREGPASPSQIWYLSYAGGKVDRITNDLNNYVALSLTADSADLVTVASELVSNIWIAPNNDARHASQITDTKFDGVAGVSWTSDGKIVYASRTTDNLDIWVTEANGGARKQLTADAGNNSWPATSWDGRYIVFMSDRGGTNHIWRMDIDGNNTKQLTNGIGELYPECSPIGPWVVYQSADQQVLKLPLDGGEPVQLIQNVYGRVAISPDGKRIAAGYDREPYGVAVYPFAGGDRQELVDIHYAYVRWTPDGRSLAYFADKYPSEISSQPVDGGPPIRLTNFNSDRIFGFAWSKDGKQLALARGTLTNDVVLIKDFRDQR